MRRGPSGRSGTGQGTLGEVWDELGGPSRMFGTGRGTREEVRDRSQNHPGGPRRVEERLDRSRTGCGTLREVRNGSGDPW